MQSGRLISVPHAMKNDNAAVQPDMAAQISSLPFPYLLIDPDHRITIANPAAENFLDQSSKTLCGSDIATVLHFSDARLQNALHDTDTYLVARMAAMQTRRGGKHDIDISIAPLTKNPGWRIVAFSEPSPSAVFGPQHKDAGAELRVQSPDILAHEIKNPLAGIKGAAQLLERKLPDNDKALTQLIRKEVERIASLVDQMQSLGSKTVQPVEPCNIYEILDHAHAVAKAARAQRIKFQKEYDPSLPTVHGSRDALSQIFLNLLSNAMEACADQEEARIIITTRYTSGVKFRPRDSDKPVKLPIEITISDNGAGVSEDIEGHLFSPFVTDKKNGQGLGLALVKKLITDMHGRIYYERDNLKGLSHFRLLLPSSEKTGSAMP